MKLNRLLEGVLNQVGGQSWQQAKFQAEVIKAQRSGASTNTPQVTAGENPFLNTLASLSPAQLPTPPTDATDANQMALYNQQLLEYINRLNAQQALNSQRMQTQMAQLAQAIQQNRANQQTAGVNSQYPQSSSLSSLSGVVNTQPDSLLLDASTN